MLKKYFTRSLRSLREEEFRISARPSNILYLSLLYLGVKAQQYFVSLIGMFIDKKTLLKIWLDPGLNLNIFLGMAWVDNFRFSSIILWEQASPLPAGFSVMKRIRANIENHDHEIS